MRLLNSVIGMKAIGLLTAAILTSICFLLLRAGSEEEVQHKGKVSAIRLSADGLYEREQSFHSSDNLAHKRIPDAIVVGAGKCGTDALITYLNTSNSFVVNTIFDNLRELNYFNSNYDKGTEWYISNMPPVKNSQVLIEKCAPYMWNHEVPARVYKTKPDMKIIMVLCDPVKRMVSLYSHINSYKLEDGSDPLPSFSDIIQLKDGKLVEKYHPRPSTPFLESGKYSDFVEQWSQHFSFDKMLFISGEDLIKDPLSEVRKVTAFLGKPDTVTSKNVYYDEKRGYYCFKSYDGSSWCMDSATKGRRHPELSPALLMALQNHFEPYNRKLESMVRINFGWPKYFGKNS